MNRYINYLILLALMVGGFFIYTKSYAKPEDKKKLLVLVLASDNHPAFLELQDVWRSYMNLNKKDMTAYFIKGDVNLNQSSKIVADTLFTPVQDNYKPGILKKTVLSLESFGPKLDNYDYVLRTNLSSFYDFPQLLAFLDTLPKEKLYAGAPLLPSFDVPPQFARTEFAWGAGFILSSDMAKMVVENKDKLFANSETVPDDVLIGALMKENQIPVVAVPVYTFKTRADWLNGKTLIPASAFHFRAKSHYVTRRLEDPYDDELFIAAELTKRTYPNVPVKENYQNAFPLEVKLNTLCEFYSSYPSDINEHLPVLKNLAKECNSVTEIGVRSMVSTWAMLEGLSEGKSKNRKYTAIDLQSPPLHNLLLAQKLAKENQIAFSFLQKNDMHIDIEPVDLLFIDSLHTYAHLTYELEKFAPKANKYIALHDTSQPWEDKDDYEYHGNFSEYPPEIDRHKRGLWPAVVDFLAKHPEWVIKERRLNNHGLTVMQRVSAN